MNFLKEKGYMEYLPQAKKIFEKYHQSITLPVDVCVDDNGKRKEIMVKELPANSQIMDIGSGTIERYSFMIKESDNIVMKGPVGIYEKQPFEEGTKKLFEAVKNSEGFSLVGGGHTVSAIKKLQFDKNDFGHVCLAGGALKTYLSGKKLPVLEALKKSAE